MKKLLFIVLSLVVVSSLVAFEQGTKSMGGFLSYNSSKSTSDSDAVNTIMVMPYGGYFLTDNIMAEAF